MIRITSIRRWRMSEYDETFLIIRSTASLERHKSSVLRDTKHVPELSPSRELFWQQLDYQKTDNWNQETFDKIYKPAFIKEIENNPDADKRLDEITKLDKNGSKIALLCFCPNENLCHRVIIGEMLKQRGCNVIFDRDTKRGVK